jgi:hypothetical protein
MYVTDFLTTTTLFFIVMVYISWYIYRYHYDEKNVCRKKPGYLHTEFSYTVLYIPLRWKKCLWRRKKKVTYIPSFTNYVHPKQHGKKSGRATRENQKPQTETQKIPDARRKQANTRLSSSSFRRLSASDFHKMSARTGGLTHVFNSLQKVSTSISPGKLIIKRTEFTAF